MSTTIDPIERTEGDTAPWKNDQLLDANGNPVDVTGSTIKFNVRRLNGALVVDHATVTLVTPATGIVRPAPTGAESAAIPAGTYDGEYEVTYQDLTKETFPTAPLGSKIPVIIYPQLA